MVWLLITRENIAKPSLGYRNSIFQCSSCDQLLWLAQLQWFYCTISHNLYWISKSYFINKVLMLLAPLLQNTSIILYKILIQFYLIKQQPIIKYQPFNQIIRLLIHLLVLSSPCLSIIVSPNSRAFHSSPLLSFNTCFIHDSSACPIFYLLSGLKYNSLHGS